MTPASSARHRRVLFPALYRRHFRPHPAPAAGAHDQAAPAITTTISAAVRRLLDIAVLEHDVLDMKQPFHSLDFRTPYPRDQRTDFRQPAR